MNIADLAARFEYYAINNSLIKHDPDSDIKAFLLCDVQDVQISVKNGIKFPCLFIQTPEVEKDGGRDSTTEHFEGSFVILATCPAGSTAAFKIDLLNTCKTIADQVYNRMMLDSEEHFDSALVKTSEGAFGPVAGYVYGWGVNFGFEQGYNAEVTAADWEDLD
jgi:hypothetical protein